MAAIFHYHEWEEALNKITGESFMPMERLFELASLVPRGQSIVEVGSYCGKSSLALAAGASAGYGARVYTIDTWGIEVSPFNPYNVIENLGYVLDKAEEYCLLDILTPLRGYSVDMAKIRKWNIGLLFIDAGHYRNDVETDIQAWTPHLASGGAVLFHDYEYPFAPDVKAVVDEWRARVERAKEFFAFRKLEPVANNYTFEAFRT